MISFDISEKLSSKFGFYLNTYLKFTSTDKLLKNILSYNNHFMYSGYKFDYDDIIIKEDNVKIDNTDFIDQLNLIRYVAINIKKEGIYPNYLLQTTLSNVDLLEYNYIIIIGNFTENSIWSYNKDKLLNFYSNSQISDEFAKKIRESGIKRTEYKRKDGLFFIKDNKLLTKIKMVYKDPLYIVKIDHTDDN